MKRFDPPESPMSANICHMVNRVYPPATARPFKGGWVDKRMINERVNSFFLDPGWRIKAQGALQFDEGRIRLAASSKRRNVDSPHRRIAESPSFMNCEIQ
jgi:hypothetical protein